MIAYSSGKGNGHFLGVDARKGHRMGYKSKVLDYIKENGSITSYEAFTEFGATRLAAIIFELRKIGYPIITLMVDGYNREGNPVRYGKYILNGEKEPGYNKVVANG